MHISAGGSTTVGPRPVARHPALLDAVAERLDRATGGVCVITAPAGYGKTTQASIWARSDGRPVAWVDVQPRLDDRRVVRSVVAGELRRAGVELDDLTQRRSADHEGFVLVLDGVHELRNQQAIELLDSLLHKVPERSTVVVTSRGRPPVHLARLSVDGSVSEISDKELALGVADARAVADELGIVVTDAELVEVIDRTAGWPVGVRLAVASLATNTDDGPHHSARATTIAVERYLREEWLRGLDQDQLDFLVRTSGVDALTGPLCDAVLGRRDSSAMLTGLARSRQLVVPTDERGSTFRVHPMLRELLDADFVAESPSMRSACDLRASDWFEQVGDIERALAHAFRARDFGRAEDLIARHALAHHLDGRFDTVRRWLGSFPPEYAFVSVPLCLMAAVSAMAAGDGESARTWLRFGERIVADYRGDDTPQVFHELAVYRAMVHVGPIADVLPGAEAAYGALGPGTWHASACLVLGAYYFALGHDRSAALLAEGAVEARLAGAHSIEALCRAHLSIVHGAAHDWAAATAAARRARQILADLGLEDLPTLAIVTAVSSQIEAREGNLERARDEIARTRRSLVGLAAAGPWANIQSRVAMAQAALLLDDRVLAQTLAAEAEGHLRLQPDGLVPKAQLVEIEDRVRIARRTIEIGPSALTNAELRVLRFLPTNLSLEGVADRLFVSRSTVNSHTRNIYRKLGVSGRRAAVETARAAGLLAAE